jgi:Transglycosylase SLT domain
MGAGVSLVLSFTLILGGALLLASGVRNQPLGQVLASITPTKTTPSGHAGQGTAQASTSLPASAAAKLKELAKTAGWDSQEEQAWLAVIGKESGGNPAAKNSETGAYGIGQLNPENAANPLQPRPGSTASQYPKYAGNPVEQIEAMFEYIVNSYGTPSKALESETSRGYY